MRDAMNDEYKEFGNSVRDIRQNYAVAPVKGSAGARHGMYVADGGAGSQQAVALPSTATP